MRSTVGTGRTGHMEEIPQVSGSSTVDDDVGVLAGVEVQVGRAGEAPAGRGGAPDLVEPQGTPPGQVIMSAGDAGDLDDVDEDLAVAGAVHDLGLDDPPTRVGAGVVDDHDAPPHNTLDNHIDHSHI